MNQTNYLNPTQKAWLETASPRDRACFFAAGQPGYIARFHQQSWIYYAAIRGAQLGCNRFNNYRDALNYAKKMLKNYQRKSHGRYLNEHALGIADDNFNMHQLCLDHQMRLSQVIHLGGLLATCISKDGSQVKTDEPELIRQLNDLLEGEHLENGNLPQVMDLTGLNSSKSVHQQLEKWLPELLLKKQFGYLVRIEKQVPIGLRGPHKNIWDSTWAQVTDAWFYAETLELAVVEAAIWAEQYLQNRKQYLLQKHPVKPQPEAKPIL